MEKKQLERFVNFRRELHANPEVSNHETETQKRILSFLNELEVDGVTTIADNGVLVKFNGKNPGKTVMIRGDIDALPIQEVNDFDHKSRVEGVSHKCGHDGHAAILTAVAQELSANPIEKGQVYLLFQPAEENGHGAKAVLADEKFDFEPDVVIALHNVPGFPLHQVVVKEGAFTPAVTSIIVKYSGKTSHAAEPELGINPAEAIGELIQYFSQLAQPDVDRDDFAVVTPVYLHMGDTSYGVSAGYGEVHYTLRTWGNDILDKIKEKAVSGANDIGAKYNLNVSIEWTEEFAANINHPEVVEVIRKSARENDFDIHEKPTPFKWGEDFGLFTKGFNGAMFGLGAGEDSPALHNPDYDFPDELIESGSKMFVRIIHNALNV